MTSPICEKLFLTKNLDDGEFLALLTSDIYDGELFWLADKVRRSFYGTDVYIRGLIEFTSFCKNDCFYCGLRKSNKKAERYRLTDEEILSCCHKGYALGFRTFVLQGGEDMFFTDKNLASLCFKIKSLYPDTALTLSFGERTKESYKTLFFAGADRYLLRHETADEAHYSKLHPSSMSLENRKRCLFYLKEIGYRVGSGFMVGSPYQTPECILKDLNFLKLLQPDMIGIGPFVKHGDTPFADFENGSVPLTLRLIALLRLMFPYALIPATTALGTLDKSGREKGLKAGANVIMPNLSPPNVRKKYSIYENKSFTGSEAAECLSLSEKLVASAGYKTVIDIGDVKK